MAFFLALVVLVMLAGSLSAQGVEEYCSSERAQGEACYQQCCESLGYSYSGGCNAPESEYGYLDSQCGYCTDAFISCRDYYEQQLAGGPSYPSSGSGSCCASAILLSLLGFVCIRAGN